MQVRLVGGKIVRSQQQHEASVTSTSSPKYDPLSIPPNGDFDNDAEQKRDKIL